MHCKTGQTRPDYIYKQTRVHNIISIVFVFFLVGFRKNQQKKRTNVQRENKKADGIHRQFMSIIK